MHMESIELPTERFASVTEADRSTAQTDELGAKAAYAHVSVRRLLHVPPR